MRVIIDTDAGVDDAQAIMLALSHPDVTVEAITMLTGNVHLDKVTRNVSTVLDVMGRDIPIYRGADLPLISDWEAEDPVIHGYDGMGDWQERPETRRVPEAEHAANALVRLVNESPGELTIITLGPLTNIALALRLDPTFAQKVKKLVFMGGTIEARGNAGSVSAEFNIYIDPEAAYMTLKAFPNATMLSWETTLAHPIPFDVYDELASSRSNAGRMFKGITHAFAHSPMLRSLFDGFMIPDPLAVAVALQPDLILQSGEYYVSVELTGALTRGQTVIDYWNLKRQPANVEVVQKVDIDGVIDWYRRMLS